MLFRDLVTILLFDDVWMKEVMANFMAAKIVNPSFPEINHDLPILLSHYPFAYGVARTEGAHTIRLLATRTQENLTAWSHAWVGLRGRPELTTRLRAASDGTISGLSLTL